MKSKEKEIKHEMYLTNERIKQEKKRLKELRAELEKLQIRKRVRKK